MGINAFFLGRKKKQSHDAMCSYHVTYGKERIPTSHFHHNFLIDGFTFYGRCWRCNRVGHTNKFCPLVRCRACRGYVGHATDQCKSVNRRGCSAAAPSPAPLTTNFFHVLSAAAV